MHTLILLKCLYSIHQGIRILIILKSHIVALLNTPSSQYSANNYKANEFVNCKRASRGMNVFSEGRQNKQLTLDISKVPNSHQQLS